MQIRKKIGMVHMILCVLLITGIGFTSCGDKNEIDDTIVLNSFGPSPALRGGDLRFIGNNLKGVTSIVLPGLTAGTTVEVTDITVVDDREIRIKIPQTAGVGIVTLKTPQGDIVTKTPLTYSEPISIESVLPASIKAGQKLTIKGDYLNLIKQVVFFEGVIVRDTAFLSQTRKQIELTVPAQAQTGKIILSNGAEIPIEVYSKDAISITLPTFTSFTPTTIKPGTTLTITGKDLDLVDMVEFGGGKIIPSNNFTVNTAGTEIKIVIPNDAQDGVVNLIAKSGVVVASSNNLTTVMPSGLKIEQTYIKNKETLTITGANLDLVSKLMFGDIEAVISSKTADKIVVIVPEKATATVATLITLSTKTIETPSFKYVKPVITSLNPTTLMAGTGLTFEGIDLDLVKQVKFPSSAKIVDVTPTSASSISLTVPTDATSGSLTLITVNGTEVVSPITLTVTAADIPVITNMPTSIKPGKLLVIKGTKLNLVKSVVFENGIEATQFETRSATLLEVYVPETAKKGLNNMQLVTFAGKTVTASITISGTDPIADPSYVFFDFDSKGSWWGSYGAVENNNDLSLSGKYFRINKDLPAGWVDFFWRNSQNDMKVAGVTVAEWAVKMDVNVLGVTTPAFKFRLNGTDGDFWAIIPGFENKGGWYTVTIPLTNFKDGDGYGSNTLPNVQNITKDFGLATAGTAGSVNMCIDNVRFEKIAGAAGAPKYK